METSKNKAANNEAARKLCLQLNISEAFQNSRTPFTAYYLINLNNPCS